MSGLALIQTQCAILAFARFTNPVNSPLRAHSATLQSPFSPEKLSLTDALTGSLLLRHNQCVFR
jgi:hypothetical protein